MSEEDIAIGTRVTVSDEYLSAWKEREREKLAGRKGTVISIEAGRYDVMFDKRHIRGAQIIYTFFSPDALVRIED